MLTNLFNKSLVYFSLAFIGAEILSYLSWLGRDVFWGSFNLSSVIFLIVCLFFAIISWKNLLLGCYLVIAEIIIGVHGYLLFGSFNGITISLRMAFFGILIIFWLLQKTPLAALKIWRINLWPFLNIYLTLIAWGVFRALIFHNQIPLIIKDLQPWLLILLLPIFIFTIVQIKNFITLWQILIAGSLVLSLKTILLSGIFSHWPHFALTNIYPWLRLHYLAEVTPVLPNFFRFFSAGQIYILIAWILCLIIYFLPTIKPQTSKERNLTAGLFIILSSALLLSLSRSFWLAIIVILILFSIMAWRCCRQGIKKISWLWLKLLGFFVAANIVIFLVTNVFIINIFDQRISVAEAAATSRTAQLIPLITKINEHAILGSGWGETFNFISSDPRVREQNPNGYYVAWRSEWGYLDLWLKLGLLGLALFLFILFNIARFFLDRLRHNKENDPIKQLAAFALLSILALATVHLTSPYLNHPLGITWLIIEGVLINFWIKFYVRE